MLKTLDTLLADLDPRETQEWIDSFDALCDHHGMERAHFILTTLLRRAHIEGVRLPPLIQTPYVNSISPSEEPAYPGDERIELRIRRYIRWNAVAMVVRANRRFPGLGGHLATYASAATLYEVGFHHFFRGSDPPGGGDQIFFQGHSSPGIYARAFLEGRLSRDQIDHFRREVEPGRGLSSYPHPWLMPDFWRFPTVSMGLGPIAAIYQARFNRYLQGRGICDTSDQRVWCFVGDGECDEPESLGALHLASRERLSNLVFVVNCNLQRLDGPVRGNGKIIQELEATFHGAGWRVIKVIWGREWDPLFAADHENVLARRMGEVCDGEYQKYSVESGAYIRKRFFETDPRLAKLVQHLSDDRLTKLRRGGHDLSKVYAAYRAACDEPDLPTVILAKTVKGWTLGEGAEGRNIAHQAKKMKRKELRAFRDRLQLDLPDEALDDPPLIELARGSQEQRYLLERREALGGFVPARVVRSRPIEDVPERSAFQRFFAGTGKQEASTTAVISRMLASLLDHEAIGRRIVPIIPDEARTFGLDALFRKVGIYSSVGQLYDPVDSEKILYYRESKDGQVLEEGLCEAGAMASVQAAGTSYATHGEPMLPFYVFYSMFGFQRTGDQAWALGDMRGRGFLIGATAGRTTLSGEGLQHQDGHSLLLAANVPSCVSYDPAYAYEIAIIVQDGIRRMLRDEEDVFYYITVENEGYPMPPMPDGVEEGILRGIYRLREAPDLGPEAPAVDLLGSGPILGEALGARDLLAERFGVRAQGWSVTSYTELRRDALRCERASRLGGAGADEAPYVTRVLQDQGTGGPVVAATDYVKLLPEQVARFIPGGDFTALGTDGYGRSDTRAALRRHFEVDAASIAHAALWRLARRGQVSAESVQEAQRALGLRPDAPDAFTA